MNSKTKKIAFLGVLASLAMVLSYFEFLLPPIYAGFPGIKMGLPNIVIIFALYRFGIKEAAAISFVRLICVTLLFGTPMTFWYSLAGAVLSLLLMWILKSINLFSITGVSVVGGISHNIGQTIVAILLMGRIEIGYYLVILTITGSIAGTLIGLTAGYLLKLLKKVKI